MLLVNRFEGEYALIEFNKKIFHIPKILLPKEAKAGDAINFNITVVAKTTEKATENVASPDNA